MLNHLSFSCSETYLDDSGMMCMDVEINGKVFKYEVIGINPVNGWYLLKEIGHGK